MAAPVDDTIDTARRPGISRPSIGTLHYRDTCSRCIDLEKQISELRQEQQVRNLSRFWTYQIKRRDWPGNWAGPGTEPPTKFLAYFLSFFFWLLCGLNAEIWLGFYPTWAVLVACALMILTIELTIVKTPVYVAANDIGSKSIGYGPIAPETHSGHSSRRTPIDTCPKV